MHSAVVRLLLLAPIGCTVPAVFERKTLDFAQHEQYTCELQRLRGRIYAADGAVPSSMLEHGRHIQPADSRSWHILMLVDGSVQGALRYTPHSADVRFEDLDIAGSATASPAAPQIREAVEGEIAAARARRIGYAEFGGWVLSPVLRAGFAALQMILAGYALSELLGGCLVIATATMRCASASILKRIGGRNLETDGTEIPGYYDPRYGCEMQILSFDSSAPNPKYKPRVQELMAQLPSVEVIGA